MSTTTRQCILFLIICLLLATFCLPLAGANAAEAKTSATDPTHHSAALKEGLYSTHNGLHFERSGSRKMMIKRRVGIGSMAPTCTYNECRGCKYKCRAEQIPVDGNDPINSPYHYKCVCHRS